MSAADPLSCACSLSRSLPVGADLSAPVTSPDHSLSHSVSRSQIASRRAVAPRTPFLLSLCHGPALSDPPSHAHRSPTSAHLRTSSDFSATTPAHAPSSLLRALPVFCAHPSPHFAQLHPLSRSAHAAGDPHPRSRPSSSPETAPSLPELCPEVRHPSPCPISPIAPCARPISPSPVLGHGGPPRSRGGRPI